MKNTKRHESRRKETVLLNKQQIIQSKSKREDLWKVFLSTDPSASWSFLRWKKHSLSRGSDRCSPELQMAWNRTRVSLWSEPPAACDAVCLETTRWKKAGWISWLLIKGIVHKKIKIWSRTYVRMFVFLSIILSHCFSVFLQHWGINSVYLILSLLVTQDMNLGLQKESLVSDPSSRPSQTCS